MWICSKSSLKFTSITTVYFNCVTLYFCNCPDLKFKILIHVMLLLLTNCLCSQLDWSRIIVFHSLMCSLWASSTWLMMLLLWWCCCGCGCHGDGEFVVVLTYPVMINFLRPYFSTSIQCSYAVWYFSCSHCDLLSKSLPNFNKTINQRRVVIISD